MRGFGFTIGGYVGGSMWANGGSRGFNPTGIFGVAPWEALVIMVGCGIGLWRDHYQLPGGCWTTGIMRRARV